MKITPLEIRQKTFEKAFRGLDKDEVYAYLLSLSQEWERLQDEKKELRIKLEASEREVKKLREVESSLFKTLKTAEDTGANMIDQATKAAELHLKETQIRAEALMNEAKCKAKNTMEEAELKARQTIDEMEDRIKALAQTYKKLENYRHDLLADIKGISQDALEKVERIKAQTKHFDLEEHLMMARNIVANYNMPKFNSKDTQPPIISNPEPEEPVDRSYDFGEVEKEEPKTKKSKNTSTSFFDDIE